jgi:hypothetical protein
MLDARVKELDARVKELENRMRWDMFISIDKNPGSHYLSGDRRFHHIPLNQAVHALMANAGVKYTYKAGTPDAAVLERSEVKPLDGA